MSKKLGERFNLIASIATIGSFLFFIGTYIGLLPDKLRIPFTGQSVTGETINFFITLPLQIIFLVLTIVFIIPVFLYVLKRI